MQWFYAIYNSKYCDETWTTITSDWSFMEFLDLENQISILVDKERAADMDMKRQETMQKNVQNNMR